MWRDFQSVVKRLHLFVPIEFSVTLFVVIQLYCIFYCVLHRISMHLVRVDAWICSWFFFFCFVSVTLKGTFNCLFVDEPLWWRSPWLLLLSLERTLKHFMIHMSGVKFTWRGSHSGFYLRRPGFCQGDLRKQTRRSWMTFPVQISIFYRNLLLNSGCWNRSRMAMSRIKIHPQQDKHKETDTLPTNGQFVITSNILRSICR